MQLQFRIKPTQSIEDIDPARLEAAVRALSYVESVKVYDDRHSDATFTTLIVTLRDPDTEHLAALQHALSEIERVHVSAVDPSGKLTALDGLAPERLPEVARYSP